MKREIDAILISCAILVAFLFVASAAALDMDLTCGSYIVSVGDRRNDVLRKCGAPSFVESWQEVRVRGDINPWMLESERKFFIGPLFAEELVTIEEWEYNLGPNRFLRYLRFENGRLTRVTTGDYGY